MESEPTEFALMARLQTEEISWLEERALRAFEKREIVYFYQLPNRVGRKTMSKLVEKGFVELVDPTAGRFSQGYGWRLKKLQ